MMVDNNPAQRLYEFITKGPAQGNKEHALTVFSRLLDVPEKNTPLLLSRIGAILELPDTIRDVVMSIDDINHDRYLSWHKQAIVGVQSLNLRAGWSNFANNFPPQNMTALGFCSDLLETYYPEQKIEEKSIADILVKIDELILDLDGIEIPTSDWYFIHHQLISIREAFACYEIKGLAGIDDAYSQVMGAVMLSPPLRERLSENTKWKAFCSIIRATATLLSIYGGVSAITHDFDSLIGALEVTPETSASSASALPSGSAE